MLFLFSAVAGAVMIYGMSLLYGLTGTLRLPELAAQRAAAPVVVTLTALGLVLVGYGFKITLVPFHTWAPHTGAPTPISGYLSVGPKAAGRVVLLRTLLVTFPESRGKWLELVALLATLAMTVGNLFALRLVLIMLGVGTVASGVLLQPWIALANRATEVFMGVVAR